MNIIDRLDSQPRPLLAGIAFLLAMLVGIADYLTGYEIGMDLFYLFPIIFLAWYLGVKQGVVLVAVTMVIMTISNILSGKEYSRLALDLWNTSIRFGFYIVVVFLIARLRSAMQERSELIGELQETLKEVKELRGILPICSSCKKIRDDAGYWQDLEAYIHTHTNAEFSHGLCKECAKKLYPQIFDKIDNRDDAS